MTELLKDWLNSLGLSAPITDLEKQFADGYLLGEVLSKHGAQPDFALFTAHSPKTPAKLDARVANFNRLHESLSSLGIRLTSVIANDIMTEKRGVVGKLLYHLRMTLTGLSPTDPAQLRITAPFAAPDAPSHAPHPPRSHGRRLDRRSLRASRPLAHPGPDSPPPPTSSALAASAAPTPAAPPQLRPPPFLPPITATVHATSSAAQHDAMERRLFQARLRDMQSVSQSSNAALSTVLKRFADHRRKFDADVAAATVEAEAARTAHYAEARRRELAARAERARAAAEWERQSKTNHERAITLRLERERAQAKFELTRKYKSLTRAAAARASEADAVVAEIDGFEKNLRRMGVGEKENKAMEDELHNPTKLLAWAEKAKAPPVEHMRRIRSMVPTRAQMEEASAAYLAAIKSNKADEVEARKERQKRRRKVLLEQQKAHLEMEEKRIEQLLLAKLMRQSRAEADLAANLMRTRYEKQVIYSNRLFREAQYAARRQADFDAALARDAALTAAAQAQYRARVAAEKDRHTALLRANTAAKYARDYADCSAITNALVDLALKVAEYRYMTDNLVPAPMMAEWVACLVAGLPLFRPARLPSPPPTPDADAAPAFLATTAPPADDPATPTAPVLPAPPAADTPAPAPTPPTSAPPSPPPASPAKTPSSSSRRRSSKHHATGSSSRRRSDRSRKHASRSSGHRRTSSRTHDDDADADADAKESASDDGNAPNADTDGDDTPLAAPSLPLPDPSALKTPPVPPLAGGGDSADSLNWSAGPGEKLARALADEDAASNSGRKSAADGRQSSDADSDDGSAPGDLTVAVASMADVAAMLDDLALDEYISGSGEWLFDGPPLVANHTLGDWVAALIAAAIPPPPPPPTPVIPAFPLKVALIGKPCTGKSYMASRLAQVHGLAILTPVGVVEWALATAPLPPAPDTDADAPADTTAPLPLPDVTPTTLLPVLPGDKTPGGDTPVASPRHATGDDDAHGTSASGKSKRRSRRSAATHPPDYAAMSLAELGAVLRAALRSGAGVADGVLVGLFVARIKALDGVRGVGGWVLDGFPVTPEQARLLEAGLSGYGAEARSSGGGTYASPHRKGSHVDSRPFAASAKRGSTRKSRIAPPSEVAPPPEAPPISHLDLVVDFELDDDAVFRRALGRVVDPVTNLRYHLEFDPPPADAGIADRLVPVDDAERTREQLIHRLSVAAAHAPGLAAWFASFADLYARIPADGDLEHVFTTLYTLLDAKLEAKTAAAAADAAAAAEAEERAKAEAEKKSAGAAEKSADAEPGAGGESEAGARSETAAEEEPGAPAEDGAEDAVAVIDVCGMAMEEDAVFMLLEQWFTLESVYTQDARVVFRHLRELRYGVVHHLFEVRRRFAEFLCRPAAGTQELVDAFVHAFNAMEADLRLEAAAKAELFQQTDDLRDALWSIADKRLAEAEAERALIMDDHWAEDAVGRAANLFIRLIQLEVDRTQATGLFVADVGAVASASALADGAPARLQLGIVPLPPVALLDRSAMLGGARAELVRGDSTSTVVSMAATSAGGTPSRRKTKAGGRRSGDDEHEHERGGATPPPSSSSKRRSHRGSSRSSRAERNERGASSGGAAQTLIPASTGTTLEDIMAFEHEVVGVVEAGMQQALALVGYVVEDGTFEAVGELGAAHVAWAAMQEQAGSVDDEDALEASMASFSVRLAEASLAASSASLAGVAVPSGKERKRGSRSRTKETSGSKSKRGSSAAHVAVAGSDVGAVHGAMASAYATAFAAGLELVRDGSGDGGDGGEEKGEVVGATWRGMPTPKVLASLFPLGACGLLFEGGSGGAGGESGGGAGGLLARSPLEVTFEALPASAQAAVRARYTEAVVFVQRVRRVCARGRDVIGQIGSEARATYGRLDDELGARFKAEVAAVNALVHHARVAVESERYLSHELRLEETSFVINERAVVRAPSPEPPAPPVTEAVSERRFTVKQVVDLALAFAAEAPSGMVSVSDFVLFLLRRKAAGVGGTKATLPEAWAELGAQQFELLAEILDVNRTGSVDWREFVMLLVLPRYPSAEEVGVVKRAYAKHDEHGRGRVSREAFDSVPLFFEREAMDAERASQAEEDEAAAAAAAAAEAAEREQTMMLPPSPGPMTVGRAVEPLGWHGSEYGGASSVCSLEVEDEGMGRVSECECSSVDGEGDGAVRMMGHSVPLLELTGELEAGGLVSHRSNLTAIGVETPAGVDCGRDTGFPAYSTDAVAEVDREAAEGPAGFGRARRVKELFAFMFLESVAHADSGASGVDYVSLLRYLCRDVSGMAGMEKAWLATAVPDDVAEEPVVSIIQLKAILEHAATPLSLPEDDNPFSRKGLHQVFHELGLAPSAKVSFHDTVSSSLAPLLAPVMYTYTRKATHLIFDAELVAREKGGVDPDGDVGDFDAETGGPAAVEVEAVVVVDVADDAADAGGGEAGDGAAGAGGESGRPASGSRKKKKKKKGKSRR